MTYDELAGGAIRDLAVYITVADLTAAAVTQTLTIPSPPLTSKYLVLGVGVEIDTEFDTAGGGDTVGVEVGNVGDPDQFLGATAVGHGAGTGLVATAPGTFLPQLRDGDLKVKFTAAAANLDTFTEGVMYLRLWLLEITERS